MEPKIEQELKKIFREARYVCFLGGAGVSTGSGISDFRSPQGLYNVQSKYGAPYEVMLSHTYYEAHPDTFYEFYWETMVCPNAKPNRAHYALANYEKKGHNIVIVTQNIDGLHQDAGSKIVLEVHGSTRRYYCPVCGKRFTLDEITPHGVPHCPECDSIIKPDVVLYEEGLPEDVLMKAVGAARRADVMLVGGTSLNVYPIAALPQYFLGNKLILVNKEPTPYDSRFDYVIHEDIGDVLERILDV